MCDMCFGGGSISDYCYTCRRDALDACMASWMDAVGGWVGGRVNVVVAAASSARALILLLDTLSLYVGGRPIQQYINRKET